MAKKLQPGVYFGTSGSRRDLGGLILAESAYQSGQIIPAHEHANPFFCIMLEGWSTQSCDRKTWTSGPGSLMIFPACVSHANQWHETGGRALHVEFAGTWLETLTGAVRVPVRPIHFDAGPPAWLARRVVAEFRCEDEVSPLALQGLALELLAETLRPRAEIAHVHPPQWLDRVRELLQSRFAENLSLGEIAMTAGISAAHLARSFRECQGCTVGEYVRNLRVESACRRLAGSDDGLAQIALAAGFADQSHLTRTFKRHMRITPAAFRSLHRSRKSRSKL